MFITKALTLPQLCARVPTSSYTLAFIRLYCLGYDCCLENDPPKVYHLSLALDIQYVIEQAVSQYVVSESEDCNMFPSVQ